MLHILSYLIPVICHAEMSLCTSVPGEGNPLLNRIRERAKTVSAELRCNHFIKLTSKGTAESGACVACGKEMGVCIQSDQ